MAGDWIKVEENMPDKPEVYGMAAQLGIEVDAVVGKLIRVWSWASRNCPVSGRTDVRSLSAIDRVAFMPGFANAMASAGWRVTSGDRQAQYGPPDQDFRRIAAMWGALKGVPFSAREVAMFMVCVKLSRETHQKKRDNWVDIAGYAKCGSLCGEGAQ